MKQPVLNDQFDGKPVVVLFDGKSKTARLYSRKIEGKTLSIELADGKFTDKETGSTWDPTSGKAIEGKLSGTYLQAQPAIVSFFKAWKTFHPKSVFK